MRSSLIPSPVCVKHNLHAHKNITFSLGQHVLSRNGLTIDLNRRECEYEDELISLTRREFDLLALLMANAGRLVSRSVIMQTLWDAQANIGILHAYIARLRAKIEICPERRFFENIHGKGYRLR